MIVKNSRNERQRKGHHGVVRNESTRTSCCAMSTEFCNYFSCDINSCSELLFREWFRIGVFHVCICILSAKFLVILEEILAF